MNRTDPSSLSIGRRLRQLEQEAVTNQARVKELETNTLSSNEKEAAKEFTRARRAERNRAAAMISSYGTTADDLLSLDTSALTKAQSYLVEEQLKSLAFSDAVAPTISFSPEASLRLDNWRKLQPISGPQAFAKSNSPSTGWTEPMTAFQKWSTAQDKPEAKRQRKQELDLRMQQELTEMHQAIAAAKQPKPEGRHFGASALNNNR